MFPLELDHLVSKELSEDLLSLNKYFPGMRSDSLVPKLDPQILENTNQLPIIFCG